MSSVRIVSLLVGENERVVCDWQKMGSGPEPRYTVGIERPDPRDPSFVVLEEMTVYYKPSTALKRAAYLAARYEKRKPTAETFEIPRDPNIRNLSFKHEGSSHGMAHGPVWKKMRDGTSKNLVDSKEKDWTGEFYPEWFTFKQAEEIAKWLGVRLEEV